MESIGTIIRKHRIEKNMTQVELGKKVFVSKQAVSKWETGRTTPDIEMIRKLCTVLEISEREILGGSICETNKKRKWLKICIIITAISILLTSFFALDGFGYIERNTQSGLGYLMVFSEGELLSADHYDIETELKKKDCRNGYEFDMDYGEVRGTVTLKDNTKIEYGFVNTNNWHNVQIRLDISRKQNETTVVQTISYKTDNDLFVVITEKAVSADKKLSVFREGV